ncbi:response regulator [Marinobacter piscensis]|uniref:response regulator n=1 Tax=Marinobacter piscensis TaxID=1562308 RepID=UPI001FE866DB|nr:response regulator [Marinobacter piscensis]
MFFFLLLFSLALSLIATGVQVYTGLAGGTLSFFLFLFVVILLTSVGLVALFRFLLSRRLSAMASYVAQLNLDTLENPPEQGSNVLIPLNGLYELEQALNGMRRQALEDAGLLQETASLARAERDEAIAANLAKNHFLAGVSHELRTPLQSVLGYASLLADTPLDHEQREYVHTLISSSEGLSAILNDLLDISSMEAHRLELEHRGFDLRDTLNDLVHMLGGRAREKHLALELRIDEHLPQELLGDPARIRQILLNLVSNAIRFTDSGHVLISVEVLGRKDSMARLRLAVEDTGVGIQPKDIPRVYEPYVQLGERSERHLPGAGLGLTVCHQLVSLMDGNLQVDSHPGEGSTFWFEVSLNTPPGSFSRVQPDSRMIQGKRILVADSYALSRKITLEMLSRHEVHIEAVTSAEETLALLRQSFENRQPFDLLILDGFLPDMDSDVLCAQVRGNPMWDHLRLLVLSSNPQRGDAEHFRRAGADGFLSKSLRESCLTPILNTLFVDAERDERQFLTRFSLQADSKADQRRQKLSRAMKVLLVEDNPVNRTLTRRILEKLGCDVTTAADGEAASGLWQWHRFDLVLMDCIMPNMDGFEATRRLRAWEEAHQRPRVPVVALTASAREEDEEHCRLAGMDSFVAKPVNIEMLGAVLEQYAH